MKRIIKTGLLLTLLASLAGCNDAAAPELENGLYINEAAPSSTFNQQVESLVVTSEITTSIHLRVAQPLDKDLKATIGLSSAFVEEYNSRHGASYQILPEKYLSYDTEAVIPAGTTSSEAINITIKPFTTPNGEAYCIPICIESADADIQIMEATSRIMYLLTGPLVQKVPMFDYSPAPTYSGDKWGISTDEWTLETWFNMDNFGINNQAIFTVACSEGTEIYVRFGDANVDYDMMQVKTGGSQFELTTKFEPYTWYHFALTYSASGEVTAYINGEKAGGMTKQNHYVIDNMTLCGSGIQYFPSEEAKMAQIRFWSKCLPQTTIKSNMNRAVDPASSGLIGYWKLDEGQGNTLKDSSPNGHDLVCAEGSTLKWTTEDIDFTDPNKSDESEE